MVIVKLVNLVKSWQKMVTVVFQAVEQINIEIQMAHVEDVMITKS